MDPVTGTLKFAYEGDYSEMCKYDRTDDMMIFQPESFFAQGIAQSVREDAAANGEDVYYLGEGPEGSMYGFMKKGKTPPLSSAFKEPSETSGADSGYYKYKAKEATQAEKQLPAGTMCILTNVKSSAYKDRMCYIRGWNKSTQRYHVEVQMSGSELKSIMVCPEALVAFTDLMNDSTLNDPGIACFKLEGGLCERVQGPP